MKLFAKKRSMFKSPIIFSKSSMLDVWPGPEYACLLLKIECKSGRIPPILKDYLSAKLLGGEL